MKIEENLYAYSYAGRFLLHNVLRSTWILIDEEELQLIQQHRYTELSRSTQNKLNIFQLLLKEPLEIEKPERTTPKTAYLVLTHQCNLKCVYCYAEADLTKEYPDSLTFLEWIDVLNQLKDAGVGKVIFTGGEIGLNHDSLKYIDYANRIGLTVGLITNGTILGTKKNAAFLAERCAAITVSLDSIDPKANDENRGRGCYAIAMRGIRHLLKLGYKNISANAIVTNQNLPFVDETIEFFKENGISYKIGGFSELGRANTAEISLTAEERKMIEWKEKNTERSPLMQPFTIKDSCGLGIGEFAINPIGEIYACKLLETDEYRLGNIRRKRVADIFNEASIQLIDSQNVDNLKACRNCSFRYLCGGGCRAHHYYKTNDRQGVEKEECELLKETIKYQMYRACTYQETGGTIDEIESRTSL